MDGPAVLALIGGVALLVALYGITEIESVKIPPLPLALKVISIGIGIILISITVWLSWPRQELPDEHQTTDFAIEPTDYAVEATSTASPTLIILTPMEEPSSMVVEKTQTPVNTPTIVPTIPSLATRICGSDAFLDFISVNPLFKRADGYTSGWITSDSSNIVLADESITAINTRYVLIVEDLPELRIQNVTMGDEHANV